ncbi:histidine kinase [Zymomonas mobilis subsp. mobilis ZM4 = ATCC 31821]|uniref:histidine kinase n=1 Tax=Zymomonas mobilis subsp. mobilis (strain ATCC 31821 / ZM4 / CP4) TaxID=264203 RepID=Q5NMW3_ZYMMO|nr:HAMP domain-containing sensor histidine kinase [Zymomonas mobilis]AAV89947.1 histidine kinase [Zymomonas mobilis subsp. mobilis ZM4 = ATCC 31821]AVZ26193.1 histidine kinase [Zymomonas mobilis subsp. mobilis]AVZ28080.1 histidine kinase [Zymomonas mobilis subsp. mobilis]AVZ42525.1 histidine kinase [Zymomonas mobilis subsp. mobilis ZM4 = ATCC 31821]UBQ07293.1 HAMP domain-containing histidine kinase [Zymomonas mobilis]
MVSATDLPKNKEEDAASRYHWRRNELALGWSARWSLTARILAVNIFVLLIFAGTFFYVAQYRDRLTGLQTGKYKAMVELITDNLENTPEAEWDRLIGKMGQQTGFRIRIFNSDGKRQFDSWDGQPPTYTIHDPKKDDWQHRLARTLDRINDIVVHASPLSYYQEPKDDRLQAWPEAVTARSQNEMAAQIRWAADRTPLISIATPIGKDGATLFATDNPRYITHKVRRQRFWAMIVLLVVTCVSVGLSLFLARTIVHPLKSLAKAAVRVRLGRAREVKVPRLPARRDEIGLLARSLSDMNTALQQRIDATEAFAADVTHELKNPLASLRSAVDSLEMIKDDHLRQQLIGVIRDDIQRLDRLITDISEASRVDAEMARSSFEVIDLGPLIQGVTKHCERRPDAADVRIAFARPQSGIAVVLGDGTRLTRVVENLIDNAISFSPPDGLVTITTTRDKDDVVIRVEDEGPGVPDDAKEEIFRRFHSVRPSQEAFGRHSGLGLAIAKATVEAHHGTIEVAKRSHGKAGASFIVHLPAAPIIYPTQNGKKA